MFIVYMVFLTCNSSHMANVFYNIWNYAAKTFTAYFCMYQDALSMINHNQYHSSIVCGSTLRDSTQTNLRGCVLPCNSIEYYVIAYLMPMGPEYPLLSFYGL